MVPHFGLMDDDAVCPGKRVVSWINVCDFYRPTKRKKCLFQSSVASSKCHGQWADFFRSSATVFCISRESASSDTARASDIAPTSALKIKIALDLAVRACLCPEAIRQSTECRSGPVRR